MTILRADQSLLEHSAEVSLIVHHHLGLGDHFICNGLVHSILGKFGCSTLFLITKPEYAVTVRKLYEDFPAVKIVELPEAYRLREGEFSMQLSQSNSVPLLKVSFKQDGKTPFDFAFYRQLGIPFINRWTQFRAPQQNSQSECFFKRLITSDRYCLIANQSSLGEIEIDVQTSLPVYRLKVGMTENMLDWTMVITNATEIHCVDSAALHLVDSLNLKNTRLVYHNIGKGRFFCASDWISLNAFGSRVVPIARVAPVI